MGGEGERIVHHDRKQRKNQEDNQWHTRDDHYEDDNFSNLNINGSPDDLNTVCHKFCETPQIKNHLNISQNYNHFAIISSDNESDVSEYKCQDHLFRQQLLTER